MIKITLKKSLIASNPNQKLTAKSLGLKKIGDTIVIADDAATAGKIRVLSHLVSVEKAD
ncbi:MAG: 50S ribosomal protein L30 [Firmicutes bacterium]|nr:50S ribosomal protein L30 [Bacillota bacterium]